MANPVHIFISYSHEDDGLRQKLRAHLSQLEHEGLVEVWDDRAIPPGEEWEDVIDKRLEWADAILLLISSDFIASHFCHRKELQRARERHHDKTNRAIVIPVILRSCDWQSAWFEKLQALPLDGRSLSEWTTGGKSEDQYFEAVVKGLRERLEQPGTSPIRLPGPGPVPPYPAGSGRRWLRFVPWGVAMLVSLAAVGWWFLSARVDREIADSLAILRLGRYGDAVERLEPLSQQWLVGYRARPALEKARLGAILEEPRPDLERFEQRLKSLRARSPDDPDLSLLAGDLALRQPDGIGAAIRAYERAAQLVPGLVEAYFHWADALMTMGDFEAATNILSRGLAESSTAPHLLNARAYARRKLGDFAGAEADYRLSADQGLLLSRVELATEVLWRTGQFAAAADQQRQALEDLERGGAAMTEARNALPWSLEIGPTVLLTLRDGSEKAHYTRLCLQASQALLGTKETPGANYQGAQATDIAEAVAAALQRVESDLSEPARSRGQAFRARLRGEGERAAEP